MKLLSRTLNVKSGKILTALPRRLPVTPGGDRTRRATLSRTCQNGNGVRGITGPCNAKSSCFRSGQCVMYRQARGLCACDTSYYSSKSTPLPLPTALAPSLSIASGNGRQCLPIPLSSHHLPHRQQTALFHTRPKFSKILDGSIDVTASDFQKNVEHYDRVEKGYLEVLAVAKSGGGEKAELRHVQMNKKMLVMDRLSRLFDNMDEVLELSTLSGMGMPYGNIHRAGVITS